jgi:hypothetical protein
MGTDWRDVYFLLDSESSFLRYILKCYVNMCSYITINSVKILNTFLCAISFTAVRYREGSVAQKPFSHYEIRNPNF